ncbi:MAG TPA: MipA/OmpV family protein [Proteus sp.]|uniref:MipA/OmpV family protein n=1 Tax=Proteus hauseri ATCC 700826 TaxID=1354271 RepID=A0AAJ3LTN9_PROHU|nr:MipA/OmpV family protein [Proteus hauseri]OAT46896.1 hypothetical protein M997_1894 [Proteus hauseri ATCC 700826]QAV24588.1 MipA/OmpV family protein [Proteus hauseri]HCH51294.1 MipA/OmpV family protein [Proteus sp. (in: enterobacteria)]
MSFKHIAATLPLIISSPLMAGDIQFGLGLGMASAYEGSNKYIVTPDVIAQYTATTESYGVFSIGTQGAKWQYNLFDNLNFGIIGSYMQGRKEEIGFAGNKNKDLKGMGDLKGAAAAGIELNYVINKNIVYINSLTALGNREYGDINVDNATRIEFGINSHFDLNNDWSIDSNISTRYVNKNYNQAYFGVSHQQSLDTEFTEFIPKAGFKDVGALFAINYKINNDFYLNFKNGGYYLLGDAANSSITQQKYGLITIIGLSYSF